MAHTVANTVQMIAHDLKAPFNMVKLILKKIQSNDLSFETIKNLSNSVDGNIKYVDTLLRDLLSGGDYINKLEPIDLENLFDEVWRRLVSIHDNSYLLVKNFNHSRDLFADQMNVRRLLTNILANAIESMNKNASKIWIKSQDIWENDREYVEITIGNEGSYVSEENIEKIFSKFHSYNKKSGSGLGLAICCEIVKSHGGDISCRSDKSSGTEFIFTLPAL